MLEEYKRKRNFGKTSEPRVSGVSKEGNKVKSDLIFVVQKHEARNLHWDLRLEYKGVLLSWAIPKGMPKDPGDKRLAVQTEDHPLEYADFTGEIPEGEYGAGKVGIEDKGSFRLLNKESDLIDFVLKGKKFKGNYILLRPKKFAQNNWLIFKKK